LYDDKEYNMDYDSMENANCDATDVECMIDAIYNNADELSDDDIMKKKKKKEKEEEDKKKKEQEEKEKPSRPWASRSSPSGTYVQDPTTGKLKNIG